MANGFAGKRIIVAITGSIAAFKVAGWVSALSKNEARVSVIMTDSAQRFVAPLTFGALTGEAPYTAMFSDDLANAMAHIDLAQEGQLFLIAPASAQTIARLAHGMADDLLSTTLLATKAPVIVCPAMNSNMFLHPSTQENIAKLKELGYVIIDPDSGLMACKDEGPGRLPEWENVEDVLLRHLGENDLSGQKVLITAGPTREAIDPARFISNRSSGKMGYALATVAYRRGAEVLLISGPSTLKCPYGVQRKNVTSALEMRDAVLQEAELCSIIIKSAAVSDFRPKVCLTQKAKKETIDQKIELERNPDILCELGKRKGNTILVGFAAETENFEKEGRRKLNEKNLDLIVVNDIQSADAGFEADTNKVILLDQHSRIKLPFASKIDTADMIFDHLCDKFL